MDMIGGGGIRRDRQRQQQDKFVTDASNKREALEEKKNNWMRDREISILRESVQKEQFDKRSYFESSCSSRNIKNSGSNSNNNFINSSTSTSTSSNDNASRSNGNTSQSNIFFMNSSSSSSSRSSSSSSNNNRVSSGPTGPGDEANAFLVSLTEKLTLHIRQEVQREMIRGDPNHANRVRETISEKMESYLQDELSATHTCKICFEVMMPPVRTPILLFPCGHTFCKECMDHKTTGSNSSSNNSSTKNLSVSTCPYCRTPIESRAINQSLKELIEHLHSRKK